MQRAIKVKREGLKMSVCSDFVEHIWKPGSCKNCFCPRNFHQLQTSIPPLELGGSFGLVQDLNGTRANVESTPLEDDGIISLPYSKPTIAVKPTMINSDVADVWADGNLNADNPQVTKRTATRKHVLMKSGEEQSACIENYSKSILRKPVIENAPNDCNSYSPQVPSLMGLSGLEGRADRSISLKNMTEKCHSVEKPSKEKLALPYLGLCHKSSIFSDQCLGSTLDSEKYPSTHQRGEASLSEKSSISHSSDLESEGGEYCSIVDYCGEPSTHQGLDNTKTKVAWLENENPTSIFQGQDAAVSERSRSTGADFSDGGNKPLNSNTDFQKEKHHLHNHVYNHICSETDMPISAFRPDTILQSRSPLGLSQGNYSFGMVRELEQTDGKNIENVSNSVQQELSSQVDPQNEPIYAESTKRKKVQLNNSSICARSDSLAYSPCNDEEDSLWNEKALHSNCGREFQDSASQVAATITIRAAHGDDDNRTIFLSSPDSAVGVQWPCVSPTSNPENGKTSPFFEHRDLPQASSEMTSRGNGSSLHSQITCKKTTGETPAVPPKLSKGVSPWSEESLIPLVSPTAETSDSKDNEDLDIPRHGGNSPVFGPSSSLCSHVDRISSEESSRIPVSSSAERRQKYYNLAWSRQCRIEEEEEEEQGPLKNVQKVEMENEATSPSSTSDCHQGGKCSVQANKPTGMSKSASFAFEFPKEKNGIEFMPPPPPPKKQSRYVCMVMCS
ncbi:hypothetical protein JD844_009777 [Phrynosoma platyrhinos]|uniref:Uncharacterized protein n=1 Tax=Phrynosoma platyrhinos TaxID=52577 RepID=A0ABQ7TFI7_PHRPL|nr:hypothetical protein JD844_009777 [Phrynosoma platyrhinos]